MKSFIKPLLKQAIATVYYHTTDMYGDKTYTQYEQEDNVYVLPCRFVTKPQFIFSSVGVVEVAKAQMWVNKSASIEEGYRVMHNGKDYEVYTVEDKIGIDGRTLFKKVLLR